MMLRLGMALAMLLILAASPALAANGIDVKRGEDALVFGNCVPSLVVENKSAETIDYLQVELVLALTDGQERAVELQSAYRDGVLYPIAPGGKASSSSTSTRRGRWACRAARSRRARSAASSARPPAARPAPRRCRCSHDQAADNSRRRGRLAARRAGAGARPIPTSR